MRPVSNEFPVSQEFGSDATAGVAPNPNGTEVEQLVAAYGNYQPYGHAGQDIACPIGTPVHAIADGVVIWADWGSNLPGDDSDAGYRQRWYMYKNFPGIVTLIQHDGWISMYGHLSNNDAAPVGTTVTEGQLIGLSGNTKAPGVTLGAHLHVGALVDLTYSCSNGLIYGCTDPTPFYGTSALNTESATITPVQEDFMATLTDEEKAWMFAVLTSLANNAATKNDIAALPQAVVTAQVPHKDPTTGKDDGQTTSLATLAGFSDFQHSATRANVPAAVLNQGFTLPDGTATNVAGILAAINAKPAAVTNITNAPAALDIDALVARLKAELPAAVLAQLTAKLSQ